MIKNTTRLKTGQTLPVYLYFSVFGAANLDVRLILIKSVS